MSAGHSNKSASWINAATGTTGGQLRDEAGLAVERLFSGPFGDDVRIGARLSRARRPLRD